MHHIDIGLKPCRCLECEKSFVKSIRLNGDISGHKQTNNWNEDEYDDWEEENDKWGNLIERLMQ